MVWPVRLCALCFLSCFLIFVSVCFLVLYWDGLFGLCFGFGSVCLSCSWLFVVCLFSVCSLLLLLSVFSFASCLPDYPNVYHLELFNQPVHVCVSMALCKAFISVQPLLVRGRLSHGLTTVHLPVALLALCLSTCELSLLFCLAFWNTVCTACFWTLSFLLPCWDFLFVVRKTSLFGVSWSLPTVNWPVCVLVK